MTAKAPPLPDLEAMTALMERVGRAAETAPELERMDLDEVLRFISGKRAIFSGSFDGIPAVVRFYFDAPRPYARRDWEELQRTWPYMATGRYRVNEPLYHLPDLGLVVVRRSTGQPLFEQVWQADPGDRFALMPEAVKWLRAYTRPKERLSPMRAASWLSKTEKRVGQQGYARLRPLLRALRAQLEGFLPAMAGHAWRVSISHGDFHPNNLLVEEDAFVGIDTGGSAKLPIYKDMARFLTHMGRRGVHPSGESRFGVDRGTLDLFSSEFELDAMEREIWLPFMIGVEALLRIETKDLTRSRLRRAQTFYEALVEDLGQIDL